MSNFAENNLVDEVSPSEIAAVESALRHLDTQHHKNRLLGQIAQWFLVLKMYKGLEVAFTRSKDRAANTAKHRALLSALMGFGECLLNESSGISDKDFSLICSSRESLSCNVRYLREKYEQWFVEIDGHEVDRVWTKLMDEREVPA